MRHRFIGLHFRRWDNDREGSIGRFLYDNYMQASSVVAEYTAHIHSLPPDAQVADEEVESLVYAELKYLTDLKDAPTRDAQKVEYVTQLQTLAFAEAGFEKVWGASSSVVASSDAAQFPTKSDLLAAQRRSAQQRLNNILTVVERLESELEITQRWTRSMVEYIEASKYAKERKYRLALDRLQQLLLQRLLELARLNIAGIGYKMRRNISNALKTRSRAIRNIVTRVNALADELGLQQPPIVLEDVLRHQFLAEFDFLRICREDVRKERWAQRPVRDAVEARLRIRQAKEERTRVEVEARRLATFIADEAEQLSALAKHLEDNGDLLRACQVRAYAKQRACLNFHNRIWLDKLFSHPDFDGNSSLGVPKGAYPVPAAGKPSREYSQSLSSPMVLGIHDQFSDDESNIGEVDDGFAISEFVSNNLD
ncbi:hypothetical protein FS749_008194 [Ceratobasidium sp. UAMH 11750]|nr:hypothetical protein FS749_008194 [Ceratobasidium sp. UAMH 11750]